MAVAQIGALITLADATTIEASDFNSNYTDIRSAFNALVTATNTLAGGVSVDGALTVGGTLTMSTAVSKVVPGATSWGVRNNADGEDNIIITNAGAVTFRSTVGGITTLTATTPSMTPSSATPSMTC